jgi:hypothetical protein
MCGYNFVCIILKRIKTVLSSQAWWCMAVTTALRRLRQEDHKFKVNLGYLASSKPAWAS